jgi:hypothetical protein
MSSPKVSTPISVCVSVHVCMHVHLTSHTYMPCNSLTTEVRTNHLTLKRERLKACSRCGKTPAGIAWSERSLSFIGREGDRAEHRDEAVVIVDPFSTGAHLAKQCFDAGFKVSEIMLK